MSCVLEKYFVNFAILTWAFNITVYTEYGVVLYSVYLFLASVWWSLRWKDATGAPYTHAEDWVAGANDLVSVLIIIATELAGGIIFYRLYLAPLWAISKSGIAHSAKLEDEFCFSDIQVIIRFYTIAFNRYIVNNL